MHDVHQYNERRFTGPVSFALGAALLEHIWEAETVRNV